MCKLLPYSCLYENGRGDILRLDEAPILIRSSGLFDYQWSITTFDRAGRDGGKAVSARRAIQDKSVVLDVFADTQEEHNAALNHLHDVIDYDMCTLSPGRLWVNGQYIRCFAYASAKTLDRDWTRYTAVKLNLKVVSPAWISEETVTMLPSRQCGSDTMDKRYPGKYAYKYSDDGVTYKFDGGSNSPLPMIIKIFGACSSPSVYVGGNEYSVNEDIASGEYVVINQEEKSIVKFSNGGVRSNIFNKRKKSVDNFLYAPAGNVEISCSGDFPCEVTFLVQRSEPEWN